MIMPSKLLFRLIAVDDTDVENNELNRRKLNAIKV